MKVATLLLIGMALVGSSAALHAGDPAGASQVVIAFAGGAQFTSSSTGTCVWYLPLVRGLDTPDGGGPVLFSSPGSASRQTAYLIWVSDFNVVWLQPYGPLTLVLVPAGTATVYYSATPEQRDFSNLSNRETWGEPVATFIRKEGLIHSSDGLQSDTFIFSADLVSSKTFRLNGKPFNFRELIPQGMTCFEAGRQQSLYEAGTCIAAGVH